MGTMRCHVSRQVNISQEANAHNTETELDKLRALCGGLRHVCCSTVRRKISTRDIWGLLDQPNHFLLYPVS